MGDSTLITMRKDVFELILSNERAAALQDNNIKSLTELLNKRSKPVCKMVVIKGGKAV